MQHRYQPKSLPGYLIRVVDTEDKRVEGVWDTKEKVWLDIRGLLNDTRNDE